MLDHQNCINKVKLYKGSADNVVNLYLLINNQTFHAIISISEHIVIIKSSNTFIIHFSFIVKKKSLTNTLIF
jgi:hypothetical protein